MDERFQTIAHHAHDALAAQSTHGHAQMKRLCRRIPHRTQNLKPLPTTRTRQSAQGATHSRPKPDRCTTRKTSYAPSVLQAATNATLTTLRCTLDVHLQRITNHRTCFAEALHAKSNDRVPYMCQRSNGFVSDPKRLKTHDLYRRDK